MKRLILAGAGHAHLHVLKAAGGSTLAWRGGNPGIALCPSNVLRHDPGMDRRALHAAAVRRAPRPTGQGGQCPLRTRRSGQHGCPRAVSSASARSGDIPLRRSLARYRRTRRQFLPRGERSPAGADPTAGGLRSRLGRSAGGLQTARRGQPDGRWRRRGRGRAGTGGALPAGCRVGHAACPGASGDRPPASCPATAGALWRGCAGRWNPVRWSKSTVTPPERRAACSWDSGSTLAADCIIAATGVRPAIWLAGSGLALASDGFVAVADGQQSVSHPEVFAAGDTASRVDAPHARSGVYAVRAGPVLTVNLQRTLTGLPPIELPAAKT